MKKLMVILFLVFAIARVYAQKNFDLTFIASPQVSWMTSDSKDVKSGGSHLGFGYGVEGNIFLQSNSYMIVTGMTVSSLGGSLMYKKPILFDGTLLPAGTTIDYSLTSLEFPLALKIRTRNFLRTRFFAQFGLTNWLNIKAKVTSTDGSFQDQIVRDAIRLYQVGLNIGAGMEYDLGHGNALSGGLIYSDGFNDSTVNTGITDMATIKVLRIRLGFVF